MIRFEMLVKAVSPSRYAPILLLGLVTTIVVMPSGAAHQSFQSPIVRQLKSPKLTAVPGEILVRFRPDSKAAKSSRPAAIRSIEQGHEFTMQIERFEGSDMVAGLRLSRVRPEDTLKAILALSARPDVLYAEPNYIRQPDQLPNDPHFGDLWALKNTGQNGGNSGYDIDAELAWNITTGSKAVVVGIIDGGIDTGHADLKENMWQNPGEIAGDNIDNDGNGLIDDVNGWDFVHNDKNVFDGPDEDAHGTHLAGIIGGTGNNGIGVVGVNWHVSLMSIKACGVDGCSDSNLLKAYEYARKMKQEKGINLRVLNNSYGGLEYSQSLFNAIQGLNDAGILFVAAAGNETANNEFLPQYPANYDLPNIVSVGSLRRGGDWSSFSNFSKSLVQLIAPGEDILSTTPRGYTGTGIVASYTEPDGSTYSNYSGTSMATAEVSGAAALVVSAKPDVSVQQLKGALIYGGEFNPNLNYGVIGSTTSRMLNAHQSILAAQENDTIAPAKTTLLATPTGRREFTLNWNAPGDDGMAGGPVADYDIFFVDQTTAERIFLPTICRPANPGTQQETTVKIPYRHFAGTFTLRSYDNAGNYSDATTTVVSLSPNAYTDPYEVTIASPSPLSTGGDRLPIDADDSYYDSYNLPFSFPFYGPVSAESYVKISSNGAIYFTALGGPPTRSNGDADDPFSTVRGLNAQGMIAGLWEDIDVRACMRSDAGIYVVKPDSDRIIFRWQGVKAELYKCPDVPQGSPINFEIELKRDGTIQFRYGAGNENILPVVGIGLGEPGAYVIDSHTSDRNVSAPVPINLTNAPSVTFTQRKITPAKMHFSASQYSVNENAGKATITITRTGDLGNNNNLTCLDVVGGTAVRYTDYLPFYTTLFFAPGETAKTFDITIVDDSQADGNKTVFLQCPAAGPDSSNLGDPHDAVLNIVDDDTGPSSPDKLSLLTEQNSANALALDSSIFTRDPFPLTSTYNLSSDHRTRISLFALNLSLLPNEDATFVNAQAEDALHRIYNLPIEYVGAVPNLTWLTQVVVKLPDNLAGTGEIQVSISLHGVTSNKSTVNIK